MEIEPLLTELTSTLDSICISMEQQQQDRVRRQRGTLTQVRALPPLPVQSPARSQVELNEWVNSGSQLFTRMNLSGLELSYASMERPVFLGADMTGSQLEGCLLPRAIFKHGADRPSDRPVECVDECLQHV